jgi:hypothetical protein
MGWYAYGVKEHFIDGGWSDYHLSNLAGHLTSFTITINITLCDTVCWESTVVIINGEEVPAELSPGGAIVTVEYNSPFPVSCDISVYCPGNDVYILNNIVITPDKVINIPLSCKKFPVRNLYTNPVSLIASWDAPQVIALEQYFESDVFPPAGWQMQSQGDGWFRTDDGSGGGWTIPSWNSFYACTNDLLTSGNDGSQDYLITPNIYLDYRPDYILTFESYYDGDSGQSAYIEYAVDGEDWEVLDEMDPSTAWEDVELNLSPFSGPDGPSSIWFAFHADDNGQDASGWAVDNVRIYSPEPPHTIDGYWVYVNDSLFAVTENEFIDLAPLNYGEYYTISVKAHYPSGLSIAVTDTVWSQYLYPPSNLDIIDSLNGQFIIMYPPLDTNGVIPFNFLGYNLFMDMDLIGYFPHQPGPTFTYMELEMPPGFYSFSLNAVYDLTPYGFPFETGESMMIVREDTIKYGYPLPFLEQWNNGIFDTQNWTTSGGNWSITGQEGNPSPSAQFTWDPVQSEYGQSLTSFPLLVDSLEVGNIYLDFDIRLENVNPTGNEKVLAQVWDWDNQAFSTVASYSNADGSFAWAAQHIDITQQAMGNVIQIRFWATGENSLDILGWYVDNIHVYRTCNPPRNLVVAWHWYNYDFNLSWQAPLGATLENYIIQWDDGVFSGNSIGTGDEVEFDAAARWTPEYLSNYSNCELTEVSFIPNEHQAVYRIRVWSGENAENLIIDQEVQSPIIGDWNVIPLDSIIDVNINEELWVGYNVNTPAGYPAGVDNGPAVNGYGNMMNFGGWQTLLEINPDFDYNWSIKANIKSKTINDTISRYAIYRSDEWQEYFFRGYAENEYYHDDSAICGSTRMHCYKIKAIYENEIDFCESDFSDLVCEVCEKIWEQQIETGVKIYPNPARNLLNIESSEKIQSVTIFDSRGITMEQWNSGTMDQTNERSGDQAIGHLVELPVSSLAPGLYLVRVVTARGVVTEKVVVGR